MLTQIVTFLIFVAVIGCILYGRKLIKTEKVDAVFGNPERALGGTHWVIVGSSFLLLVWLYYSWDIAKGFYPKSANELCQVAKVNDSLLGLKYQFPIEEREFKSTSQIKKENKNLNLILNEIQNSQEIDNQQKTVLAGFIKKTNQLIPLLTNEDLIENETKQKINDITGKINLLTENFQKPDYPFETEQELNERLKAVSEEGGWGIVKVQSGTGSIENTMEVPLIPATDRGLKFHTAAQELNLISDEFFKLRNHNPEFKNQIKELKEEIKSFRKDLDSEDLSSAYAKNLTVDLPPFCSYICIAVGTTSLVATLKWSGEPIPPWGTPVWMARDSLVVLPSSWESRTTNLLPFNHASIYPNIYGL